MLVSCGPGGRGGEGREPGCETVLCRGATGVRRLRWLVRLLANRTTRQAVEPVVPAAEGMKALGGWRKLFETQRTYCASAVERNTLDVKD